MSWQIANIDNTVKISQECYKELEVISEEEYFYIESYNPKTQEFPFHPDNNEGMDVISNEKVMKLLQKYKVNGKITFGDFDGDNFGELWGYSFTNGNCIKLKGTIGWINAS